MKMKALIISLFVFPGCLLAQTPIDRSQIFANQEWGSPGFVGANDLTKLDLAYRQVINSTGAGLNVYQFGIFAPLNNSYSPEGDNSSFAISDPSLLSTINSNKKLRRKHGLGAAVSSMHYQNLSVNNVQVNYAYHLPLTNKLNVGLGTAIHWESTGIGVDQLTLRDPENDILYQNLLQSGGFNNTTFYTDFGVSIYGQKGYLNLNLTQITLFSADSTQASNEVLIPSAGFGYRWSINSQFSINTNLALRINEVFNNDYIFTLRCNYREMLYIGAGYHHDLKTSGFVGFKLPKAIFLNYSYDIYANYGEQISSGTHELSLTYLLNNKKSAAPLAW